MVQRGRPLISIHAPPRGATFGTCNQVDFLQISIHAPPRGATMPGFASGSPCLFQFTPLREGRQFVTPGFTGVPISIHAPPRGATGACASLLVRVVAFQFTPLREGRRCRRPRKWFSHHFNSRPSARGDGETTFCPTSRQHFNSRPSARGDVFCGFPTTFALQISIHAPPRGATKRHLSNKTREIFQFTPLREGRRQKICNFCKSFVQPLQISMA